MFGLSFGGDNYQRKRKKLNKKLSRSNDYATLGGNVGMAFRKSKDKRNGDNSDISKIYSFGAPTLKRRKAKTTALSRKRRKSFLY